MSTARSIHVGMSFGSPHPYGEGGDLADSLGRWAAEAGYQPTLLVGANATPRAVLSEIDKAAKELVSGDCLLITYTGHGGHDSTGYSWKLNGGDLPDNRLASALRRVPRGVQVVVVLDSCYSEAMFEGSPHSDDVLFIAAARKDSIVEPGRLSKYLVERRPIQRGQAWSELVQLIRRDFKTYDWQGPYFA